MYEVPENYISPYNLNERIKRLDRPELPELPCICDPECMCFDLCAGDLTQNCLCEENGLFCRITEGWDIDDLDIPDREDSRQAQFVIAEEPDQAWCVVANSMAPSSPTLNLAIQLSTMDRAQLKKLRKYFKKVERLQQKQDSKISILKDEGLPVWTTLNTASAGRHLAMPPHERVIKSVAHPTISFQDNIPENSTCQIASAIPSSRRPIPIVSWDKTILDMNRASAMKLARDHRTTNAQSRQSDNNTADQGRVRKSLITMRSAFYRKFLKSRCFDGDLIDELIRPSPFKTMPLGSIT